MEHYYTSSGVKVGIAHVTEEDVSSAAVETAIT
jgi:hypothetical protein